jgi:hypothetical protein
MGDDIINPEDPSGNYNRYKKTDPDTDQDKDYIIRSHMGL